MSAPNSLTFPDHTYVDGYLHKIYGYRYNWHKNAYEIDIVLKGTLEFCRGGEKIILHQDDFLIVDPGIGHASYPLEPDTVTLVLHFSARALADFQEAEVYRSFSFHSDETNRKESRCRLIRYFSAQLIRTLSKPSLEKSDRNLARSALGMIAYLLCNEFPSQILPRQMELDISDDDSLMAQVTEFISENCSEKIKLQDVADRFHYNRTYISGLFRKTTGIGFYEYLTRIRFHWAVLALGNPEKNLSQVAIDNGFPDLKSFNQLFEENLGMSPKVYRGLIRQELAGAGLIPDPANPQTFLDPEEPSMRERLEAYLAV